MNMRWIRGIALLCLVALAIGCVHKKKKSMDAGAPFPGPAVAGYEVGRVPHMPAAAPGEPRPDEAGPMLAWNASLALEVLKLDPAVAQALAIAEQHGGYLEWRSDDSYFDAERNVRTHSSTRLRLRIPAAAFSNALDAIEALGPVISRTVANEDVAKTYVDAEARLKNKQVLRTRLRGLLEKAADVKDVLAIETELNRVQGDIDALEAQLKGLQGRVDFAALDLTLRLKNVKPKKILGPLGLIFHGLFWTIEKLFVIRE